jgi:hypothetical protein
VSESGEDIEEVRRRLEEIQRQKRGRVRWTMSRRTAEMALVALDPTPAAPRRKSAKGRRRKRHKRLL